MVSSPQHEPTMEEILASIRKIISEDSTEQPAAEVKPAPAPEPEPLPVPEPEADILELTQEVSAEEPPPEPAPTPVVEAPPPVPQEQDVVFEPIEEPEPPMPEPPHSPEGIFSDRTRQSIDDAFASLDHEEEEEKPVREPSVPAVDASGASVESVFERAVREAFEPVIKDWLTANAPHVIDKMKPLIREWMDEHFPALLEGAVRDEVARVAKARGTKR